MIGWTPATRMNLLRAERRLARVKKGVELLKKKREALVAEFFRVARPAAAARSAIAEQSARAYPALLRALAALGRAGVRALGAPARALAVDIRPGHVWGIPTSTVARKPAIRRTLAARGTAPGATSLAAAAAATEFETLADLLIDAAPRELLLRRLGDALARTSRQVNGLERRIAPEVEAEAARIRATLDERERDERTRLRQLFGG